MDEVAYKLEPSLEDCTKVLEKPRYQHQNIYELMCEEWDGYEEIWIIKMQAEGLVKQDLNDKEWAQLWELITYGEY